MLVCLLYFYDLQLCFTLCFLFQSSTSWSSRHVCSHFPGFYALAHLQRELCAYSLLFLLYKCTNPEIDKSA